MWIVWLDWMLMQPMPPKSLSHHQQQGAHPGPPTHMALRAVNNCSGLCHSNCWQDDTESSRQKWCPRVTFLEDIQKPEQVQSNLPSSGHKYMPADTSILTWKENCICFCITLEKWSLKNRLWCIYSKKPSRVKCMRTSWGLIFKHD